MVECLTDIGRTHSLFCLAVYAAIGRRFPEHLLHPLWLSAIFLIWYWATRFWSTYDSNNTLVPPYFDEWISTLISEMLCQKHFYLKDKRWCFLFSFFWAFAHLASVGCGLYLLLSIRQTLPSFTLSLIVCFQGSGETSSICFQALLARLCLLKLMVPYWFNTAGRTEPGASRFWAVSVAQCWRLPGRYFFGWGP